MVWTSVRERPGREARQAFMVGRSSVICSGVGGAARGETRVEVRETRTRYWECRCVVRDWWAELRLSSC